MGEVDYLWRIISQFDGWALKEVGAAIGTNIVRGRRKQ